MKILVLNGSPRVKGNTSSHVAAFKEGAESKNHEVQVIQVGTKKINGCLGCDYCHTKGDGQCIQKDDMQEVYAAMADAEMVVLAGPIYYFGLSGQLQSAITRFFAPGKPPKAEKYALILSSMSPGVYDGSVAQYKDMIGYFGAQDMGIKLVHDPDNKSAETLEEMRAFGASL